jgi:hypothetical protein
MTDKKPDTDDRFYSCLGLLQGATLRLLEVIRTGRVVRHDPRYIASLIEAEQFVQEAVNKGKVHYGRGTVQVGE